MKFNTAECFLLIALNPKKGRFQYSNQQVNMGLIGSILFDLSIYEKIEIRGEYATFNMLKSNGTITSEINNIIRKIDDPQKVKFWINKFCSKSYKIKKEVLASMAAKRLITIEENKWLGFISYNKYYINEHQVRSEKIRKLRECVLYNTDLYTENVAILALLEACKMQKVLSKDRKELKIIKPALKEVIKENPIAESVDKSLNEFQTTLLSTFSLVSYTTTNPSL